MGSTLEGIKVIDLSCLLREEIKRRLGQTFKKKTRDEWMAELGKLDICFCANP
jgi:crotonobetainyl-CoA:carnitine CoA-transferase CaiB-like acyl-CoA transferase